MTDDVLVEERRGRVLVLRLDRPEASNALSFALLDALVAALEHAEAAPEVGAVVLTGAGDRSFCAGLDLRDRTAYHVLRSVARLQVGEQLVVLGAGGGVGSAAVELGAHLGATVTAVASSAEKRAVARELGATNVIDHRAGDLRQALRETLPGGADVIVDPVGGALAEPALRSARWGGRFVTVGFSSGEIPRIPLNLVLLKGVHLLGFQFLDFATHAPEEFARNEAELAELLASGQVHPHIGATFPLERTAEALRLVADGGAVGKVLIDVSGTER